MKRCLTAMAVLALALAGAAVAQPGGGPEGGRRGGGRGPGMRGGGALFEAMRTIGAVHSISRDLDADKKAKLEAALGKMMEKMKTAQADLEKEIQGILTPEQMEKFVEAKLAGPGQGGPGGGRRGGGWGQGQGPGQGEGGEPADRRQMLKQMDANGDGKVSKDEFKGPAQAFERLDANGDGFITDDEIDRMGGRGDRGGAPPPPPPPQQ